MHARRRTAVLFALAAAAAGQDETPPAAGRLELAKLLEWETVASPRLAPDGRSVVFTRSWTDPIEDRMRSALWTVARDGTRLRHLVDGSDPVWSPDGGRIAYIADGEPKGRQIWVLWPETGQTTQLTHLVESPADPCWSPDGRQLAFTMQVPEESGFDIPLPKPPEGAKWAPPPTVITRLSYRLDHQGYRPAGFRHVFVLDADQGGTPRQVTTGDYDHGAPNWAPNGSELVLSGLRVADADWQVQESEVYAVDVATGAVRQLTDRRGPDAAPVVSPDGRWVAYTGYDRSDDTYHVANVHLLPLAGGEPRNLTAGFDRDVRRLHWAADSQAIYFTAQSEGAVHVHRVDLEGARTRLTTATEQMDLGDVGADGTLVGVVSSPHEPGDVVLIGGDGVRTRLTAVHRDVLHGVHLGEVEEVRCGSRDGLEIQGWLVKPPDFDPTRRYPLILQIHGGPHAMYGVGFDFERQNHAASGYLVLYTNPRGSAGYGKAFGNAIKNAYPGEDYHDLMAAVDAVIARGCVDDRNLFVYGGSGGGVLTCWIVGMTHRFRAAVSMFPVTDWISFVGTTDGPYWYHNFGKLPWEDITEHWQRSPLRLVGNVSTPTMLITGELDLRTPMAQTEEYYQALKLRKVESVMVRVPDEYHGAAGRHVSNRLRRILYVRGWFERHRVPGEAGAADAAAEAAAAKTGEGK